ncbi:MAG: cytochrome b N-terminal domain-containing protein [Candidatus Scalindua sp.]|nr:cytochrome b N-terminal domain-containing protein [Candidatus Scalindua sp.]
MKWLEDRTGLKDLVKKFLDEPVEGGAKWSYVFGSALVIVFIMQIVSGVILSTGYSASATDAWGSVYYIQERTMSGWFVRGMHNVGSSAMMVLAILHITQTVIFGAYKKPRELNWISGVFMLFIILGFGLTGYLLPWDQKGFWATQVATSIMGLIPGIGDFVKGVVQGGNDYGNLTLTRFYSFHVFFLPAGLMTFMAIHLHLFRRHGVTPHWKPDESELKRKTQPFWPDQIFKDVVAAVIIFAIMSAAVWYRHGAELQSPADPSSQYMARPEWYFLFLFQLLKYFEADMEVVGAIILPTIAAVLMLAIPFLDRGESRAPAKRLPFIGGFGAALAGIVCLTLLSMVSDSRDERLLAQKEESEVMAERAIELAALGIPPSGGAAVFTNDPLYVGEQVFRQHCITCHGYQGGGGDSAPDLTAYNSRSWLKGFFRNPNAVKYYGKTQFNEMPESLMGEEDLSYLIDFLLAQSETETPVDPILREIGEAILVQEGCYNCHTYNGRGGDFAPTLDGFASDEWLRGMIEDAGQERYFGKYNTMPSFKETIGKEDMDKLVLFLQSLRSEPSLALPE